MRKRAAAMRRAGHVCERCHERIAVEVHHIDGDRTNNALTNLTAVCRECHLRAERDLRAS